MITAAQQDRPLEASPRALVRRSFNEPMTVPSCPRSRGAVAEGSAFALPHRLPLVADEEKEGSGQELQGEAAPLCILPLGR